MGIGYRGLLQVSWAAIINKCIYVSMELYSLAFCPLWVKRQLMVLSFKWNTILNT